MGITPPIAIEILGSRGGCADFWEPYLGQERNLSFFGRGSPNFETCQLSAGLRAEEAGIFQSAQGEKAGVLNLEGRVFMKNLDVHSGWEKRKSKD